MPPASRTVQTSRSARSKLRGEKLSARVVPSIPNFPVAQSANRSKAWVRIGTSLGTPVDPEVVRVSRDSAGSGTLKPSAAAGSVSSRTRLTPPPGTAVAVSGPWAWAVSVARAAAPRPGEGTRVLIP
ncbi:hypothetical protein SBADM41S_10231 [Streptomyces badius]